MADGRKRKRSVSADAALPADDDDFSAANSATQCLRLNAPHSSSSLSASVIVAHADGDYAALVERSAALLAKLKQKHGRTVEGSFSAAEGKKAEGIEPLTIPCTFEHFSCSPPPSDTNVRALKTHSIAYEDIPLTQATAFHRRDASAQTDTFLPVAEQKKHLLSELSEFFTLLHVFFA